MALSTTGHKSHPPLPSPPPLCHRSYPHKELEDLAMAATLGMKTFLLLSLLLLAPLLSSGFVEGFKEGVNPHHSFVKDGIQMMINTRKLLVEVLDYDDAGANRRHDPRGRTGGAGGGKNP